MFSILLTNYISNMYTVKVVELKTNKIVYSKEFSDKKEAETFKRLCESGGKYKLPRFAIKI